MIVLWGNECSERLQATVYPTFAKKKKVQIVQKKYKKMLATLITKN
jgi:hypothetical protein